MPHTTRSAQILRASFVIAFLALLCPPARAQGVSYPDTPAGHAAKAWFEAVRSSDANTIRNLIENHFDADFRDRVGVEQHLSMHTRLANAGINAPHSIARETNHEIVVYLRDGGVWGELVIQVSPEPPHGIMNVGVKPSAGPPEEQGRPATVEAFQNETTEFLRALHESDRFNGVVISRRQRQDDQGLIDDQELLSVSFLAPSAPMHEWPDESSSFAVPWGPLERSLQIIVPLRGEWKRPRRENGVYPKMVHGSTPHPHSKLLYFADLRDTRDAAIRKWQRQHTQLTDAIFAIKAERAGGFLQGLISRRVLMPAHAWIRSSASDRLIAPEGLVRFGEALLDDRYLHWGTVKLFTTGVGPDLDPRPDVTRRKALGFEERIDHTDQGDIRSFSARAGDASQHVLLRCYPESGYVVVIVAQDKKTLDLIDRRIFNRLPGLDAQPAADD